MSNNSTFYFQSNRRRGRSGDLDDRHAPPEFSTQTLVRRLTALDDQVGALVRGEGRAPSGLADSLAMMQEELRGLSVALKELAHLREGQERAHRENERLRSEIGALHEALAAGQVVAQRANEALRADLTALQEVLSALATGQEGLQATAAELAKRLEPNVLGSLEAPISGGDITIKSIRPRLLLGEFDDSVAESVLMLDDEP